jgi:hypothetical protein
MYVYTAIYWICCFTLLGLWLLPSWSDMSWSKAIFITVWLKHYVQLVSLNGCLLGRSLSIWMYLVYVQSLLWFQDLPFFVVGISDIGGTKACRCSLQKVCRFQYETKKLWRVKGSANLDCRRSEDIQSLEYLVTASYFKFGFTWLPG